MNTAFTKMFDVDHPVIGAPMFLVSGPALVAAVSNAGGLGTLPSLNGLAAEDFVAMLDEIERLTDRPYGVNLVLKDNPRLEADLAACFDHRVALIITSLGDPAPVVEAAHARGIKVFCDVTSMRHARKAAAGGADGLIAVCVGAGGHAGLLSPAVLVPWLADSFDLPVAMAGGVADGRGLAAALALGASAAYVGTRLVASRESIAPDAFKQLVVDVDAEQVEYTPEVTGVHCNFLKPSLEAFRRGEVGADQRYVKIWSAGQTVALVHEETPAGVIVEQMARDARRCLAGLMGEEADA